MASTERLAAIVLVIIYLQVNGEVTGVHLPETWDEKLSGFLREVLENLRTEMPHGIPSVDIPVLEPLIIPTIKVDVHDDIADLIFRVNNLKIEGISQFVIDNLRADLEEGHARFDLFLPRIKASGKCYINGKFIRIFPIHGDGDFGIDVSNLNISGYGHLDFNSTANTNLRLDELTFDIHFDGLRIKFDNLMGGGKWSQSLLKILNGLGRNLFLHFKPEILNELTKAITKLANHELGKGTLKELLDMIP